MKVSKVLFFIRDKSRNFNKFKNLTEYFILEDLKDPLNLVSKSLKDIIFYNSNPNLNRVFAFISVKGPNYIIRSKDISYVGCHLVTNKEKYIGKILNSNIEVKIILNIEIGFLMKNV